MNTSHQQKRPFADDDDDNILAHENKHPQCTHHHVSCEAALSSGEEEQQKAWCIEDTINMIQNQLSQVVTKREYIEKRT